MQPLRRPGAIALATFFGLSAGLFAADTTWTNATGNGLWADPLNWSAGVPTAGESAIIGNTAGTILLPDDDPAVAARVERVGANATPVELVGGRLVTSGVSGGFLPDRFTIHSAMSSPGSALSLQFVVAEGEIGEPGDSFDIISRASRIRNASHSQGDVVLWVSTIDAAGSISSANRIDWVGPSTISLSASHAGIDRLPDASPIHLIGGTMYFTESGVSQPVTESTGSLVVAQGRNSINFLTSSLIMTSLGMQREPGAVLQFSALPGSHLRFSNVPTGADGPQPWDRGILPYGFGATTDGPSQRTSFLTYDRGADPGNIDDDPGLRTLDWNSEYATSLAGGGNVRLSGAHALDAPASVRSLNLVSATANLNNATLTVESGGVILQGSPASTISGTGTLASNNELVLMAPSSTQTIGVPVSAPALTKAGAGTVVLNRANDLPGGVFVAEGTLTVQAIGALGGGSVTVSEAALRVEETSQTLEHLHVPGYRRTTDVGEFNLGGGATLSIAQNLTVTINQASGEEIINTRGGGTVFLPHESQVDASLRVYDGGTIHVAGTVGTPERNESVLIEDGLIVGSGTVHGFISGSTAGSATLSPGPGAAQLNVVVLSLGSGSIGSPPPHVLQLDLNGTADGEFDKIIAQFGVTLRRVDYDISVGYPAQFGDAFMIIENQSPFAVSLFGTLYPEGSILLGDGYVFRISYTGGDGNDVVLTVIPEPAGAGTLGILLSMLIGGRRRRRGLGAARGGLEPQKHEEVRMQPLRRPGAIALATSLGLSAGLFAADTTWTNTTGNALWSDAANWSAGVPTADDRAIFLSGLAGTVDLGGADRQIRELVVESGFNLINGRVDASDLSSSAASAYQIFTSGSRLRVNGVVSGTIVDPPGGGNFPLIGFAEFQSAQQFTGPTYPLGATIAGDGAIAGSTEINLQRTSLTLQDLASGTDRLSDSASVRLRGGTLRISTLSTNPVTETVGDLNFGAGESQIQLLASGPVSPSPKATLIGNTLQRSEGATASLSVEPARGTVLRLETPPQQSGGGGTPADLPIIPWARGTVFNPTTFVATPSFITYDTGLNPGDPTDDVGMRPLDVVTEYAASISSGVSNQNVRLTAPQVLSADASINALNLVDVGVTLDAAHLTLSSGALLAAPAGPASGDVMLFNGTGSLKLPEEGIFFIGDAAGSNRRYVIDVPIDGSALVKSGGARLVLSRPNSLDDGVTVNQGRLVSAVQGALGTGPLTIHGGSISFEGESQTYPGALRLANATRPFGFLTSDIAQVHVEQSIEATIDGPFSGIGILQKAGPGTLRINGGGSFEYLSLVALEGELLLNGTLTVNDPADLSVTALSSAVVGGNGVIPGRVSGGIVTPGDRGPGRLTADSLRSTSPAQLWIEIAGPAAGAEHDQLVVLSDLNLDQRSLLIDLMFAPSVSDTFLIVDYQGAGPIGGVFTGLPEGAVFPADGYTFRITYTGGDGNDVVLTVIPEPGTAGMAVIVLSVLACRRRR